MKLVEKIHIFHLRYHTNQVARVKLFLGLLMKSVTYDMMIKSMIQTIINRFNHPGKLYTIALVWKAHVKQCGYQRLFLLFIETAYVYSYFMSNIVDKHSCKCQLCAWCITMLLYWTCHASPKTYALCRAFVFCRNVALMPWLLHWAINWVCLFQFYAPIEITELNGSSNNPQQ